MAKRIIITPMGGHGTTYLIGRANFCKRPDTIWGESPDITKKPHLDKVRAWRGRSGGHQLDVNKTIEQNLVDMITSSKYSVLLCGRCSINKKFLTDNSIHAICLVRHPANAYVSYLSHQHPEHAARFGGFNKIKAVHFWARHWNAIVDDFLSSDNPIVRYEYLEQDLPDIDRYWKSVISRWRPNMNSHKEMDLRTEEALCEAVRKNFYLIYDKWEIWR